MKISKLSAQARERRLAIVRRIHPDWEKDVKSEKFEEWLKCQSDEIKHGIHSEDIEDAVEILDKFYEATSTKN